MLALACAAAPGALAGTELAGQLFFLNPRIPFEPGVVLRAVAGEAIRFAFLSVLLHLPWIWGRWWRGPQMLPWTISAVLAGSALLSWVHASVFAYYLPAGINRRLLKAAGGLSAAAIVAFFAALARQSGPRSRGRSRWLLSIAAFAGVIVMLERREAYRLRPSPAPRPSTFASPARPHLAVVGIPGATLDAILPLVEQGRLPFFARMMQEGSWGPLHRLEPPRRLPSWATTTSGRLPYQHAVLGDRTISVGFTEDRLRLLPLGFSGFWPWHGSRSHAVTARDKEVLLVWEMLASLRRRSAVIGWPLTDPLPPNVDVVLSDTFFQGAGPAAPEDAAERARWFRTEMTELDPNVAASFGDDAPEDVLEALADDLWRRELSFFLLDRDPGLDALFVHLPGLEEVSRTQFGGFAAVQFAGSTDSEAQRRARRLASYYMQIDEFLAELWRRIPSPRWIAVVSPYGARVPRPIDRVRARLTGRSPIGGGSRADADGVVLFRSEVGLVRPSALRDAHLVDLVPTLLYGLGLPIGRDLDGAVLTDAFETSFLARQPLLFLPSYEALADRDAPDESVDGEP